MRLGSVAVVTVAAQVLVAIVAPGQLAVLALKLGQVSAAGVGGYWLDRALFPYGRPHQFLEAREGESALQMSERVRLLAQCMLRRAVVVSACMVATGLAL